MKIEGAVKILSDLADELAIDSFHETACFPESSDAKLEACFRIREAMTDIYPEWPALLQRPEAVAEAIIDSPAYRAVVQEIPAAFTFRMDRA